MRAMTNFAIVTDKCLRPPTVENKCSSVLCRIEFRDLVKAGTNSSSLRSVRESLIDQILTLPGLKPGEMCCFPDSSFTRITRADVQEIEDLKPPVDLLFGAFSSTVATASVWHSQKMIIGGNVITDSN